MNLGALSLENAPGFWLPVRFLLTVPLFGVVAALILLFDGGQLLLSRWLPATLAVTHALTLGYIAMAMLGALFQMLPVLMGAGFPRAERVAPLVHAVLTGGTLCLVLAFLLSWPLLFLLAAVVLMPVLLLFAAGVLLALQQAGKVGTTSRAVQLAAVGLVVTVLLGAYMAAGHATGGAALDPHLTNLHAGWGIAGWILVLAIGVSEQVIPMFLTTPPYPQRFNRRLAWLLLFLLAAGSLLAGMPAGQLVLVLLAGAASVYAFVTLYLLARRRRKRLDITHAFWRFGMLCLVPGAAVTVYGGFGGLPAGADVDVLAGILLLAGFALSVINGMLYKIVPFLVWLNLRMPAVLGKLPAGMKYYTPNIHEVIELRPMQLQFALHVAAVLLLVAVLLVPQLGVYPAGMALLASNLLLLRNLGHATGLYRKYSSRPIPVQRPAS